MPSTQMQTEADAIAADLVSSQLRRHARRFSFPLLVYIGERIMILNNETQLLEALGLYRSILSEEWLSRITSTVTDCDCETNGSCKISVRNRYFATDGRDLGTARINTIASVPALIGKFAWSNILSGPAQIVSLNACPCNS